MLNINLNSRPSDLSPEIYFKLTEIFEKNTKAIFKCFEIIAFFCKHFQHYH